MPTPYNYPTFHASDYFVAEDRGPVPGDPVPDVELRDLDGREVRLASLWENRPAMLEFGSITCPIFVDRIDDMERLGRRYSDLARFGVIYAREAHPGEGYRHIDSIEEKIEHARDLRRAERIERMLLVDDREGTLHRWSGGFPDSVLVVGTDGRVAAYAEWNEPDGIAEVLDRLLDAGGRAADLQRPARVTHNHAPPRKLFRALAVLRRAGWKALFDFLRQLPVLLWHRIRLLLRGGRTGSWS